MKVGTRITVATSVVVAVSVCSYAFLELRGSHNERIDALEGRARDLALTLRGTLERDGVVKQLERADELASTLSAENDPWSVSLLPSYRGRGDPVEPERKRLQALIEGRAPQLVTREGERLVYSLPLRQSESLAPDGIEVLGALEVSTSLAGIQAEGRADLLRTLPIIGVILVLVIACVMVASRFFVSGPIDKLLAGIDDVARGDLSRVLLAEREDEIGSLAARFNEMTYSLRESQAETNRQDVARRHLEQQLFQTEKLATIGQIAAEIAHEVGTPLNVIAGRARGLAKKSTEQAAVEKNAHIIAEQATRITRIIQRLLDFSRRKVGVIETELVDLNRVTLTTLEFLESKLSAAQIKHSLQQAEDLPAIKGHPDQLQQVFLNLILNAIEAMPGGGALDVATEISMRRRPGLAVAPEQSTVSVAIRDSGPGISEKEKEHIFEPFYTSKSGDGGTGLGLPVVQGIVKDHDGWIEIDSPEGGGAEFRVCFPAA